MRVTQTIQIYAGSQVPPKGLPELVAEVEKIYEEIRRWRGSRLRGLHVETDDQRRLDRLDNRGRNVRILRQQGRKALARWLWGRALRRFGLS